ncbi:MAG: hypothetical protein J5882_04815 [Bacteroidales bacterium]|nr:hypothetical protein [Bacteroidales bacterium]
MKHAAIAILLCLTVQMCAAQNLYDTTHIRIFAEYLYNTQQYQFAAEEYARLADSTCSNSLDYAFKTIDCYSIIYDYKNAEKTFEKYILPQCQTQPGYYFHYVKLLINSGEYAKAYTYCDSLQSPYTIKGTNIKNCLAVINQTPADINNPLLTPEVKSFCQRKLDKKSMLIAVSMSAVLPGSGRIYCGYVREGIMALLRSGFELAHVAYGFHKYGYKDPYPLFFASLSACFYVGNIFGTAKSVNKYNNTIKKKHDEQIVDYMHDNLF